MRVTFWGTRGSIAKAGPRTVRYGGNTSCVEVRTRAGTLIVIDGGTGLHELGQRLTAAANGAPVDGSILISHTHWDHIQGIPFFAPLFAAGNEWHVYGPRGVDQTIGQILAGQMEYTYFPVAIDDLGARIDHHDLVEGSFTIDGVRVTTQYLNHPALTLAYRLEADGVVVVYSSDHEPHDDVSAAGGLDAVVTHDAHHVELLRDADLVIHDAQYVAEEYDAKRGWGHSTIEYAVDCAIAANARRLALYHRDPSRTDDAVDTLIARARARVAAAGSSLEVFAAAEEVTVDLGARDDHPRVVSPTTATLAPAIDDADREVVVALRDERVAELVRAACTAEGLHVDDAPAGDVDGLRDTVARAGASIVVVDSLDAAAAFQTGDGHAPVVVVATDDVPRTGDPKSHAAADWLVWPATVNHVRTKLRAWLLRHACRWQAAPRPPDEPTRLAALRALGLLDTPPEARFDRITALAAERFDVPIALVTLVDDDRQWFKSHHGIDVTETPRELSVCAHAILRDEVLQVQDAFADDRFADNPLAAQPPRLRFYAGAPIAAPNGCRVGTLCLVDHRPRRLDDDQLAELRRLADLVEAELAQSSVDHPA